MEVCGVVYLLIDGTNDKEYVGQTTRSVERRFKEHMESSYYIGNAIRAHGADMFITVIFKECESHEELDYWEQRTIYSRGTKFPNGYNLTNGGDSSSPCDEVRKKMSEAQMGDKNHFFGKHHADEVKAHSSLLKRGESPYKNLLAEMDKRNFSYASLAKLLGLCHQTVSDKMRGKQNFTASQIDKLVEIFGKPAEYLIARDDGLSAMTDRAKLGAKSSAIQRASSPYKNLLSEMDERGFSYRSLAELLNSTRKSVSNKMRGIYNFSVKDIAKLVKIFGKPAEYLMARTVD